MGPLNDFLSLLAQALLIIALPIIIAALVVWVRQRWGEIRSHLTKEQLSILESAATLAVRAAEQSGLSQQIANEGKAKKAYALKMLQDYLTSHNIKVDVSMIDSVIEAEVHKQMKNPTPPVDTPEARSALIDKAIESAVLAAEQSGLKGALVEAGTSLAEQKKKYALDLVKKFLAQYGIDFDPSVLDGLIEAQVLRMKQQAEGNNPAPVPAA